MIHSAQTLPLVLRCEPALLPRVGYVFDTLMMAAGVHVEHVSHPPAEGPWLLYAATPDDSLPLERCLLVPHHPAAWDRLARGFDAEAAGHADGVPTVFASEPAQGSSSAAAFVSFDLVINAFYFLSSWSERAAQADGRSSRQLFKHSIFARLNLPQDIVDRYLDLLLGRLRGLCLRLGRAWRPERSWPAQAHYAVVLSHDVDFVPEGPADMVVQGAKSLYRHAVRQRDLPDALRGGKALASALLGRRDPYGCIPAIISAERAAGVKSSFQVAVGHRHPADVNYRIERERTRDYLRAIVDAGFDLCLHGSYRSTEKPAWYVAEVELLTRRLQRPLGSRQHFLSFDYDCLFSAQEAAGIRYDMSMGFPDQPGPRAGFSHPYFPYCVAEERPYRVLQISLFLMDVTLRSYLGLKGSSACRAIDECLAGLRARRGCASVVWHPIVFGGARDPGFDDLYWALVERVRQTDGLPTDGRQIDAFWRDEARAYASFDFPL